MSPRTFRPTRRKWTIESAMLASPFFGHTALRRLVPRTSLLRAPHDNSRTTSDMGSLQNIGAQKVDGPPVTGATNPALVASAKPRRNHPRALPAQSVVLSRRLAQAEYVKRNRPVRFPRTPLRPSSVEARHPPPSSPSELIVLIVLWSGARTGFRYRQTVGRSTAPPQSHHSLVPGTQCQHPSHQSRSSRGAAAWPSECLKLASAT